MILSTDELVEIQVMIFSTDEFAEIQVKGSLIKSINFEKRLGTKIDFKATFDKHIKTVCQKARNILRALLRVIPYMTNEKKGF